MVRIFLQLCLWSLVELRQHIATALDVSPDCAEALPVRIDACEFVDVVSQHVDGVRWLDHKAEQAAAQNRQHRTHINAHLWWKLSVI